MDGKLVVREGGIMAFSGSGSLRNHCRKIFVPVFERVLLLCAYFAYSTASYIFWES
jgi:hypothetical protein